MKKNNGEKPKMQFRFMIAMHGKGIKEGESKLYLQSTVTGKADAIAELIKLMADWLAREGDGVQVES